MTTVQYVPSELTAQAWPQVEAYLEEAIPYSNGEYTLDQARMFINMGQWLLLVAVDDNEVVTGASTISFINSPNHRTAFIALMGGKFIINKDLFAQLCNVLKQRGATRIQCQVRPSMERLTRRVGFNKIATLVGFDL